MNFGTVFERLSMGRALGLGIALAAVYYVAMFNDGSSERAQIVAAEQSRVEAQKKITEANVKLEQAAVYKKTATEVGGTITKLMSLIPEKFSMPDLMRMISNEAKVAGSSLASLNPRSTAVSPIAKEFEELSISLELTGTFLQHMVFLSNLTKANQILTVRRFQLSSIKEGHGEEPTVTRLAADVVAYRYRGEVAEEKKVNQ